MEFNLTAMVAELLTVCDESTHRGAGGTFLQRIPSGLVAGGLIIAVEAVGGEDREIVDSGKSPQLAALFSFSPSLFAEKGRGAWTTEFIKLSTEGYSISMAESRERPSWVTVRVEMRSDQAEGIFVAFLAEVIRKVSQVSDGQLLGTLHAQLLEWKVFFASLKGRRPLSPDQQIGLCGELLIFEQLIREASEFDMALDAWVGPQGKAQDFLWNGRAAEVKTCLGNQAYLKISSLEQLNRSDLRVLLLVVVSLSRGTEDCEGDMFTLLGLVIRIRKKLRSVPLALNRFEASLLQAGFHFQDKEYYDINYYSLEGTKYYSVEEEFPCLTPATIPDGVRQAAYSLDIRKECFNEFLLGQGFDLWEEIFSA